MPLSAPPRRIFVIGPMGEAHARHIPNIARAARNVLERLARENPDRIPAFEVSEPPDRPSGIPREVFSHIMHCDLAIADISTASPNVMYELAMLHASGTPVILLSTPDAEIFYLNQQNCIRVADFELATLEAALAGHSFADPPRPGQLEQVVLAPRQRKFHNPITEYFGGVDLINVASAAGVATGNFYNFTRWVLKSGGIFRSRPDLLDLVLIKPSRIRGIDSDIGRLEAKFGEVVERDGKVQLDSAGAPLRKIPELTVYDAQHPRDKYFVKCVGLHLVDYPTPISSLAISRQYVEMANFVQQHSQRFDDSELRPFEERIVNVYFDTLRDLATSPMNDCDWGRVKILTVDEALDYLAR